MRGRLVVVVGVVVLGVWLAGASMAWGDDSVSPICNGQPCATTPGYWYTSAVTLVWQVSQNPPASFLNGCGVQSYSTNTAAATSSCEAIWTTVDDIKRSYTLRAEVSNPTAAGAIRPPDHNGWYNHPVAVTFSGAAFSGIASCTSTTYAGPDTPTATVTGSCIDNASKVASASVTFPYAATPPSLGVAADPGDAIVDLHWQASAGVASLASVEIVRSPGVHGKASSVIYRGNGSAYHDARVRDGVRYQYTVTARDQAGNATVRGLVVTPGPRLLAPAAGAHVTAPPLLLWTPVRRASYYNVQLYRGGKVLSAWPGRAGLQLRRRWSFDGRHYRLRPGRYRWYVWPGFGRRAAARYGRQIGTGTFVVTRA